ncbi:nucleotidyltransferase [Candidatus Saganbacteria bacterium CG08_land_8_20_14_0_20_45_16]|uniref:Nucleotidyltransferase n=1 Tax=Candidatus Saganbacteria bacterium CG08_land_8_20_14_0_20_45_16 TaxID=2014293 RepID=A0A2H0XZ10_UNCSA|nr:MAG: nucleotidyltransferase [Candidatus Saganbacteria bacterium CG08_land_8_20_14_0_20_45_16]
MLNLSSLKLATTSLKSSLAVALSDAEMGKMSPAAKETIIAGVIQNFEFTYELCWKFLKRFLGNELGSNYVDGVSRKELFRLGTEHHLISNIDNWFKYHDSRNETSHTYDKTTAQEVFEVATKFIKDAEELLANLEKRNH